MRLEHATAWCRWRRRETIHGIVRADLQLLASQDAGRYTPIPGRGKLRPLWDLGQLTAAGEPDFRIAVIWVDSAPDLAPATTGRIRLAPLDPTPWLELRPGEVITMHEGRPVAEIATIVEVTRPRANTDDVKG